MATSKRITIERLRELMHYDPQTGLFRWLVTRARGALAGSIAGWTDEHGYVVIKVDRKRYFASRLAWFYMTGAWPEKEIDHRNCVHNDNRWENLREASRSQNAFNIRLRSDNKFRIKGVWKRVLPTGTVKFISQITVRNHSIWLGSHDCPLAASIAYQLASARYAGDFARAA